MVEYRTHVNRRLAARLSVDRQTELTVRLHYWLSGRDTPALFRGIKRHVENECRRHLAALRWWTR